MHKINKTFAVKEMIRKVVRTKPVNMLLNAVGRIFAHERYVSFASLPDYSDNARAFFEYLTKLDNKGVFEGYRLVWHVKDNLEYYERKYPNVRFVKQHTLESIRLFLASDYVVSTHGLYNAVAPSANRKSILVWHGMPLKKIGYLNQDDVKYGVPSADYYIVTSQLFKDLYKEIFHAADEQILLTGQPRNDWLFQKVEKAQEKAIHSLGERLIMYMPTFRKSNLRNTFDGNCTEENTIAFGGNRSQWESLNRELELTGQVMIIKPHPMDAILNLDVLGGLPMVKVINDKWIEENNLTLYQLLAYTDKLITDYSSVYIDYLLLDRPMAFLFTDVAEYAGTRGFVFDDPMKFIPGKICQSFDDICTFISEKDQYTEARARINKQLNEITDGMASRNLFYQLNQLFKK